jgi:hypothetical protein
VSISKKLIAHQMGVSADSSLPSGIHVRALILEAPGVKREAADVIADPSVRRRERRTSKRSIVSPMKSARPSLWRAASAIGRQRFPATTSSPRMVRITQCPTCSIASPHRIAAGSARIGIAAVFTTSSRSRARGNTTLIDGLHPTSGAKADFS